MTHRLRRAAAVLLLTVLAGLSLGAVPASAAPLTRPAAPAQVRVVALPCWLNPVCTASQSVLDTVAQKFTDGAKEMLNDLAGAIDTATQVDLGEAFFTQNYAVMLAVSAPIVLLLFLVDLAGAALRRRNPLRSLVGVFQAVFGAALAVSFAELALGATDALSSYVLHQGMGGSAHQLSDVIVAGLLTGSSSGLLLVLSFFTMIAALFVWLILVLRKFAIYSVAVFAPIAFAGQAWAGTTRMAKRWAEALIALILSKFAISVLFAVAVSAIGTSKSVATVIGGLVMLIMALFSPWLCLKLVHFVEVHVAGEMLASMKSGAMAPANAAAAGMTRAQQAQSLLGGSPARRTNYSPTTSPMVATPGPDGESQSSGSGAATPRDPKSADEQATGASGRSRPSGLSGSATVGAEKGTPTGTGAATSGGTATGGAAGVGSAAAKLSSAASAQATGAVESAASSAEPESSAGSGSIPPAAGGTGAPSPGSVAVEAPGHGATSGKQPPGSPSSPASLAPAPAVGSGASGPVTEGTSAAPATPAAPAVQPSTAPSEPASGAAATAAVRQPAPPAPPAVTSPTHPKLDRES